MKINKLNWTIQELIDNKSDINPKPQYQRTEVWTLERKQKLIDTIIKGYDLPKFYVRRFVNPPDGYIYEVADGQQRMKAIWSFLAGEYGLGKKKSETFFNDFNDVEKTAILNFELSFSEIYEAEDKEINELFARLQQGVSLNPAELRNAIPSIFGTELKKLLSNSFFASSKIIDKRFTHQEYLDHVASLYYYHNNKHLKAKAMSELYVELSEDDSKEKVKELITKLKVSLNVLEKVNGHIPGYFKNKWAFVDIMNFISDKLNAGLKINTEKLALSFKKFEDSRLKYTGKPQILLDKDGANFDPELYKYINAFSKDGALKGNVEKRLEVLNNKLSI